MKAEDIELFYDDDARSVHTLLRVIDRDNTDRTYEVLFDNLRTPMVLVFLHDWEMRQETIISQDMKAVRVKHDGEDVTDQQVAPDELPGITHGHVLLAWREAASGSTDEVLLVEVYGDPDVLEEAGA